MTNQSHTADQFMARQEKVQIINSHMTLRKLAVFRKALSYIFVDKIFYKDNFIVE